VDNVLNKQTIALPRTLADAVAKAQSAWLSADNTRRLWRKDAALWTGGDEGQWLGWLDTVGAEQRDAAKLQDFGRELAAEQFGDVLLLGMGGSSLGPQVLAQSLGSAPGYPKLHVLDSTDPDRIGRFEQGLDLAHMLVIVASKSGTTLELNVLMDYFWARATAVAGKNAARHFVAITDPGSRLQKTANAKGFRRVFLGIPSIGGRYSVLSKFGLVPLAATGHDVRAFLDGAAAMARACGPEQPPAKNPGIALGLAIGVLAAAGRDKLTLVASPSIAGFGGWVEQLIAESTGKGGRGIIPIADEPLGEVSSYAADRLFVYLRNTAHADPAQDRTVDALEGAGQPVVRITVALETLAQEFFRFEIATAVAGAILGIDPFDQPDVEAIKVATREMTAAFEKSGALPSAPPLVTGDGIALFTDQQNAQALRQRGAGPTLASWLKAHFSRLGGGDYFAILAFLDATDARIAALQSLRTKVRDRTNVATSLQIGPRFLHSTGQAHKGGPDSGVFLQITVQPAHDLPIPGYAASFGVVEAAQAGGDFRVLAERGRRVLRAHVTGDVDAGIAALSAAARSALE
jgi:transaldolase/glucose-6-phosphate isomerase